MSAEVCSWCGTDVEPDDGFRLVEPEGERQAVFCRLEHIVPWAIQGAHAEPADPGELDDYEEELGLGVCAQCGEELGPARVLLVRHRAEHRIADGFCGMEHLVSWAKRGGRWRTGV